jgi:hypothetical protein
MRIDEFLESFHYQITDYFESRQRIDGYVSGDLRVA